MSLEPDVTTLKLEELQSQIVGWLHDSSGPVSTDDLLEQHAQELAGVGGEQFRRAVWALVDQGKARFNDDWRLVSSNGAKG